MESGSEAILKRLEALKRDIPPMHELCQTEHEFEDEEKRGQYAEEAETSVEAMLNLFKKLQGGLYQFVHVYDFSLRNLGKELDEFLKLIIEHGFILVATFFYYNIVKDLFKIFRK